MRKHACHVVMKAGKPMRRAALQSSYVSAWVGGCVARRPNKRGNNLELTRQSIVASPV